MEDIMFQDELKQAERKRELKIVLHPSQEYSSDVMFDSDWLKTRVS